MSSAVTFDFHNTLVQCDPWFELEVRTLCRAYLRWSEGDSINEALLADADRRYRRLRQSIIAHGHELSAEACVEVVLDQLGVAHQPGEIERGVAEIMMATIDEARPIDGAVDLVVALAKAGLPMAIVSSAVYHPFLTASLQRFGMADAFRSVVTSASSGFYKSRPEIYWTALDHLGARADRSIHVGDSYNYDVLGAHRAGLATAWYSTDPDAHRKDPAPDLILDELGEAAPGIIAALQRRSK
jgi:HAD superfamily hydrolase (TIGR01549 family)